MTDTSKDAVERLVLAMILRGNTTAANMLNALAHERDAANARAVQARDDALVEAGRVADGRQPWPPHAIRKAVLALRDTPAQAEALDAKTTPTPPDSAELDALVAEARERARDEFAAGHMNDAVFHGNVADAITTLRDKSATKEPKL